MASQHTTVPPMKGRRPFATLDDRGLILRIAADDPQAKEEFCLRFEKLVWSILHDMNISLGEQADIYQEVFVHLWDRGSQRLLQWRGEGKLCSYLSTLVRRMAHDYRHSRFATWERLAVEMPAEKETSNPDIEETLLRKERGQVILKVLKQQPKRDAELILRKHYYGQTYSEIAQALSMTMSNVGVALSRAEARLRKVLLEQFPSLFEGIVF